MILHTLRHWENGVITQIRQGMIYWISGTDGEFWFWEGRNKFWGKNDYWEVYETNPLNQIEIISVK